MATAICLSYLADYINPGSIFGFAFLGLAYPYLLLANIVFVVFWLWRKKKYVFLSLIAVIIGTGYMGRYIQFTGNQNPPAGTKGINIISFNVRIFNYYEWEVKGSLSDSILDFVLDQAPGIACFQEFFSREGDGKLSERAIKQKINTLPYSHIEYSKVLNNGVSHFGIATFSKYPIINRGSIKFNNSFNTCIFSDILIDKDTFRVFNMHLQSIHLKKDNYTLMDSILYLNSKKIDEVKDVTSRLKRAFIARSEQTLTIENELKNSPYPVILCGDFNDTPVSFTYKKLLGEKKDAYRESGIGLGNTYRGKLPSFRIDYIFYSPSFESYKYKTHRIKYSDHFPVSTTLVQKRI